MLDTTNDDDKYWEFFDESVPIVEEDEDEPEDILEIFFSKFIPLTNTVSFIKGEVENMFSNVRLCP